MVSAYVKMEFYPIFVSSPRVFIAQINRYIRSQMYRNLSVRVAHIIHVLFEGKEKFLKQ